MTQNAISKRKTILFIGGPLVFALTCLASCFIFRPPYTGAELKTYKYGQEAGMGGDLAVKLARAEAKVRSTGDEGEFIKLYRENVGSPNPVARAFMLAFSSTIAKKQHRTEVLEIINRARSDESAEVKAVLPRVFATCKDPNWKAVCTEYINSPDPMMQEAGRSGMRVGKALWEKQVTLSP